MESIHKNHQKPDALDGKVSDENYKNSPNELPNKGAPNNAPKGAPNNAPKGAPKEVPDEVEEYDEDDEEEMEDEEDKHSPKKECNN